MSGKPEAHVTPEKNVSERRKQPRKKSLVQATLVTANGSFDCRVLDFSPSGAKVEFAYPLAKKEKVTLTLRPMGTFAGVVAWCGNGCFGMKFLAQASRTGVAPADIGAAVSAPKAPAKLAAYLLAKQGSRSAAEPDALPVGRPPAADPVIEWGGAARRRVMAPSMATLALGGVRRKDGHKKARHFDGA